MSQSYRAVIIAARTGGSSSGRRGRCSFPGITWFANNDTSSITTGHGPAWTGEWGFYALPHGSFVAGGAACATPGVCGGGFGATSCGVTSQHVFFGVIEPAGFTSFVFNEQEGTNEDAKFIFADDCTFYPTRS